ncbi:MAG: GspE/PulE family protein [Patescibacteria group bacterium]|nr:GspE/PulE family protein [Patescibacteria group bacterium]
MAIPIPLDQLKKYLLQDNLITEDKFNEIVEESQRKNQSVLDVLVSEQIISSDYLTKMLSSYLGVELADLGNKKIDPEAVKLLPEDIARQRQAVIFGREADGALDVAMIDPSNLETIEFLKQYLKAGIKIFLASGDDLNRVFLIYESKSSKSLQKIVGEQIQEALRTGSKTLEEAAAALPIVTIVDTLISYAISMRASDVHIEFLEDEILIRYRIDGILYEILRMPKVLQGAIIARIKILSGLKIDEHYKPQDGRFRYQISHQVMDIRVSIIPTYYGEKVEMRLLEASQKPLSLEELGMIGDTAKSVEENLKKTYGMILVTGPTGSGKTTTLYALMNILNRPQVNIITIEDPIEYNMPFINQIQINPQAGITFGSGLRAILRQDPNIIMVGEIRDSETADTAVQASLTGHLLLASLHTNDAPTAIPRLSDLGVAKFLISSVVNLIIAQRLTRRICDKCITSFEVDEHLIASIKEEAKELNLPTEVSIPKILYKGVGCSACGGSGYRGRMAIYELLEVNDKIRQFIIDPEFNLEQLRELARKNGMITMFEDGLRKAELGLTTVDEVFRVIRE